MENPIVLLIVIGIAGVAFYFLLNRFLGGKKREPSIDERVRDIDDRRVTPNGLRLWVEDTALVEPPEIAAIEEGLNDCFVKARQQRINYDKDGNEIKNAPLSLKDYIVVVLGDTIRAPLSGDWCYRVVAENYRGTEYDLADGVEDGKILAAGQMLNDASDNYIILPDPGSFTEDDLADLRRAATYEAEHCILRKCSYERFLATGTHGAGEGHPLF
jgi:hypothetical protein